MAQSSVTYGVNVNTRVPIIYPEQYSASDVVDLGVRAEELGYDAVWVGDNFFAKGRLESVTTLAAIASRTSKVKLSTSAFILPLRHTVWLAISWATLDQISNGRAILNACVGGGGPKLGGPQFAVEFDVAGVPYNKRGEVMAEQIVLLRQLWRGDGDAFSGKFHDVPGITIAPLPKQRPAPPIWISNNPQLVEGLTEKAIERMMSRVGSLADGWMTALATPEEYRGLWERVVGYAKDAGRDPGAITPAYQMTLTVGDSADSAAREATEFLNLYYGTSYDDIRNSMWSRDPFGTVDDCYQGIKKLIDAGVRDFALRFAARDQIAQVQRFTEEVLPRLRSEA